MKFPSLVLIASLILTLMPCKANGQEITVETKPFEEVTSTTASDSQAFPQPTPSNNIKFDSANKNAQGKQTSAYTGTDVFPNSGFISIPVPPPVSQSAYIQLPVPPADSQVNPLSAKFIWPAQGRVTSGFGRRWGRAHKGIDIAGPIGAPIVAAATGVVTKAGWVSGGYGNLVEIQHFDGSVTRYGHNSKVLVMVGQSVEQGQMIAEMGSTGHSTGPHCHFETLIPGKGAINPIINLASRSTISQAGR
ncbi:MAG TPA: M23 family metallopeptidase [Oculatellaceae cyanobacterium]